MVFKLERKETSIYVAPSTHIAHIKTLKFVSANTAPRFIEIRSDIVHLVTLKYLSISSHWKTNWKRELIAWKHFFIRILLILNQHMWLNEKTNGNCKTVENERRGNKGNWRILE